MKLKKIIGLYAGIFFSILLLVGCSNNDRLPEGEGKKPAAKLGLLLDDMGEDDQSINQESVRGLREFEIDSWTPITIKTSESTDQYKANISDMIKEGAKLIWGVGYSTADSLANASLEYPDIKFICLENVYGSDVMDKNLSSVIFKTEEAAYLMGYLAADLSKTNKLAYLGGAKGVISEKTQYGFMAGVEAYKREKNVEMDVSIGYVGSFSDDEKGYKLAKELYNKGADILFQDAGLSGLGAIEASKEVDKSIMLAEKKQMELAGDKALAAIDKNYAYVINDLSSRYLSGINIFGRNIELGFKDKALDLSIDQEALAKFNPNAYRTMLKVKDKLIESQISVPFNEKTYKEFLGEKKGD